MTDKEIQKNSSKFRDILFAPLGCLLQITNPVVFLGFAAFSLIVIAVLFPSLINNVFSVYTGKAPVFSQNSTIIQYDDTETYWKIIYEFGWNTSFSGTVRHSSLINSMPFPMLSHDILVTSGEFSDPNLVSTSVSNHHFRWYSQSSKKPSGTINLLHVVPASPEIEKLLNRIKKGDLVTITGQEITRISKMVGNEESTYWYDAGCNTILVTTVVIEER